MIGKIKKLSGLVVGFQRDQWFALRRYRPNGNSVLWLPNIVIFRSKRNSKGNPKKMAKSLLLTMLSFYAALILLFASLELPTGINLLSFLASPLLAILLLVGVVKGQRDYKEFRRVQRLQQNPSAEKAAEAINHLDTRQSITRHFALQAILPVCSGTPGKLVKHLTTDISTVANLLTDRLKDDNREIQRSAATAVKWFTRDYGQVFGPHARLMSEMLKQPDSKIQAELAISLGNIGASSDNPQDFAKALTPAVKDEDPDVRQAAALGLRNLRCDRTVRMLRHLTNDSSPEVRQQAQESLQALTAKPH
ncbi:HEAT repeat domain-containing protein [Haloferax larsenii]|nr:HEAT repeat domain-containing protein [Haloferax larsenii]